MQIMVLNMDLDKMRCDWLCLNLNAWHCGFDDSVFDAVKNYPVANEYGKPFKKKQGREKGLQTG